MKSFKNILTDLAIAAALAPMLAGCAGDSPKPVEKDPDPAMLSFIVSLDHSATRASRADANRAEATKAEESPSTWGADYNQGDGYDFDSRLLSTTFRAVLFKVVDNAGTKSLEFVDNVTILTVTPDESAADKSSFRILGMIKAVEGKTDLETLRNDPADYRLMIYANEYYTDDRWSAFANYGAPTFEHVGNFGKPGFYGVPMWGVAQFKFSGFDYLNSPTRILDDDISLLRSMAMVRVQLADHLYAPGTSVEQTDVELTGLTLNRINTKGYVAPSEWNTLATTNNLAIANTFNDFTPEVNQTYTIRVGNPRPDGTPETEPASMTLVDGAEVYHLNATVTGRSIVFYLPEVANDNADQLLLTVHYRIHGDDREWPLHFCYYKDGVPITPTAPPAAPGPDGKDEDHLWDIVRNHIYEYTITGVVDAKITIEARVKDWQYHKYNTDLE